MSRPTDEEKVIERLATARAMQSGASGGCLSEETLAAYRRGALAEAEQEAVVAHLAQCATCVDRLVSPEPQPRLSAAQRDRIEGALAPRSPGWARSRGRWGGAMAAVMAAAAALIIWLAPERVAPIPAYTIALSGQVAETRGGEAAPVTAPVVDPDSELVIRVVPRTAQPGKPPRATLYLKAADGSYQRVEAARVEPNEEYGWVEIRVPAGPMLGERYGHHEVRVVLSRRASEAPERLEAGATPEEGERYLERTFDYRPRNQTP